MYCAPPPHTHTHQDEVSNQYEQSITRLEKQNTALQMENTQLRAALELAQAQVAVERDELLRAVSEADCSVWHTW